MTDGETGDGGFLERLRNSPRTVSTIIVILIVVGAIFAFSDRGAKPEVTPSPTATPVGESPAPEATPEGTSTASPEATEAPTEGAVKPTPVPVPLPEAKETDTAYIEVAARGEGVTHLARKAMLRHIAAAEPDYEVTAEHKVWMEDYLKDQVGRKSLALGENVEIQKELVRNAVAEAKKLTDAQRKNLTRYSQLVTAYRR